MHSAMNCSAVEVLVRLTRVDRVLWALVIAYLIATLPAVYSSTATVTDLIYSARNDEPALTECLESMTVSPYGNPANYWNNPHQAPKYWSVIGYGFFVYCGGLQQTLVFPIFAAVKWSGVPTFPLGPRILRSLSLLAGFLSLIFLYNFAKINTGPIAAALVGLFILTYADFLLYSLTIHPDILLVLTGAGALAFSCAYAETGRFDNLAAAGLFAGLAHGAKFGGPWLAPMLILAAAWGAGQLGYASKAAQARRFVRSLICMAVFGVLGFFLAAPHALVWRDYWLSIIPLWTSVNTAHFTLSDWLSAIQSDQGPLIAAGWLSGLIFVAVRGPLFGGWAKPIVLAAVLGVSGVLWYGITSKVVISLYYLILPFCLFTIVLGDLVQSAWDRLLTRKGRTSIIGPIIIGLFFLILVDGRWFMAAETVAIRVNPRSPVRKYTEVALRTVPKESLILSDLSSVPYFDLNVFPNQVLIGTLKYTDIFRINPNFIVLSRSLAISPMYLKLRETQNLSIFDSYSFSVKLYQDLFGNTDDVDVNNLSSSRIVWLDVAGILSWGPTSAENEDSKSLLLNSPVLTSLLANSSLLTRYVKERQSQIRSLWSTINRSESAVSNFAPAPTSSVQAIVYRVHPFGGTLGRPGAFSGGEAVGILPIYAFDRGEPYWQSSQTGNGVVDAAFVGFDFGGAQRKALAAIRVKWHALQETPEKVIIEFRDGEGDWTQAGEFYPNHNGSGATTGSWDETCPIIESAAHREWRIVAAAPLIEGRRFTIENLQFIERMN
jgi:hypothetical protein